MTRSVRLVVQGDDFGMCHAVNTGITQAFTQGVLTQSSMMVPCPWFDEAVALATEHAIPVGMHQTLTCEWDNLRWRPLTDGRSLRRSIDGTFRRTVQSVIETVGDDDATAELLAQAERFLGTGLELTYLDVHMGMTKIAAYEAVAAKTGAPFLYPGTSASLEFTSIMQMSDRPNEGKLGWLLHQLDRIAEQPGVHLIVAHPAESTDELRAICAPDAYNAVWAEHYRGADLAVLCDPTVRAKIDDLGIELVSVGEAFA